MAEKSQGGYHHALADFEFVVKDGKVYEVLQDDFKGKTYLKKRGEFDESTIDDRRAMSEV